MFLSDQQIFLDYSFVSYVVSDLYQNMRLIGMNRVPKRFKNAAIKSSPPEVKSYFILRPTPTTEQCSQRTPQRSAHSFSGIPTSVDLFTTGHDTLVDTSKTFGVLGWTYPAWAPRQTDTWNTLMKSKVLQTPSKCPLEWPHFTLASDKEDEVSVPHRWYLYM